MLLCFDFRAHRFRNLLPLLPAAEQRHMAPTAVFMIETVLKATGGFDPCFLFQGTLRTPEAVHCKSTSLFTATSSEAHSALPVSLCSPSQPLSLYISYDQPSPRQKRPRLEVAPYRYSVRDEADDSLMACCRGLPTEILIDEEIGLAVWGKDLALRFPSIEDLRQFAKCLRSVSLRGTDLITHPSAALLSLEGQVCDSFGCDTPRESFTASGSLTGARSLGCEDASSDADSLEPVSKRLRRTEASVLGLPPPPLPISA